MSENKQAGKYDAVLGGQKLAPLGAAILGGIHGVKKRLSSSNLTGQINALSEALNYGDEGIELIIKVEDYARKLQEVAYKLLIENKINLKVKQILEEYNTVENKLLDNILLACDIKDVFYSIDKSTMVFTLVNWEMISNDVTTKIIIFSLLDKTIIKKLTKYQLVSFSLSPNKNFIAGITRDPSDDICHELIIISFETKNEIIINLGYCEHCSFSFIENDSKIEVHKTDIMGIGMGDTTTEVYCLQTGNLLSTISFNEDDYDVFADSLYEDHDFNEDIDIFGSPYEDDDFNDSFNEDIDIFDIEPEPPEYDDFDYINEEFEPSLFDDDDD